MFIWDESKREKVIAERGIDFAKITDIFDDPFLINYQDYEHSDEDEGEIRRAVIGKTAEYGLIVVIYTVIGESETRFITARRAEKWMEREYEKQRNRY